MSTVESHFRLLADHFEEPWFYTHGPQHTAQLTPPMYGYYNAPFGTHPEMPLRPGDELMFHRQARHNLPHDAFHGDNIHHHASGDVGASYREAHRHRELFFGRVDEHHRVQYYD